MEAELVGVDNIINFVMWVHLFVAEPIATIPIKSFTKKLGSKTVIQLANTTSIKLEVNGKQSSTKDTRHTNIQYFYRTSKVKNGEMKEVVYHPTKEMVSDYPKQMLQGVFSKSHCNAIIRL